MSRDLTAALQLRRGEAWRVGPDRMSLLAAVAEHGSISAAGRSVGLTYRAAWDGVRALNNLFGSPLVTSQSGGRDGGGAQLTDTGTTVLAAYQILQRRLTSICLELDASLDAAAHIRAETLIWSLGMKTSARNALHGVIDRIALGAVNAEVVLRLAPGLDLVAIVDLASVAELDLAAGREAVALIKSSFVILAPGGAPLRTSARNRLVGTIVRHDKGAVNDEVVLELDHGKTLTATITRGSGEALDFAIGRRAQALIKASHIILAVNEPGSNVSR